DHLVETDSRCTFTYGKPLLMHPDRPPEELDRLDNKNWTPTPVAVQNRLIRAVESLSESVDAIILLEQVSLADTGVITRRLCESLEITARRRPDLLVLADSRRGLRDYPPFTYKMNRAELQAIVGAERDLGLQDARKAAALLAKRNDRPVFVTLAEE